MDKLSEALALIESQKRIITSLQNEVRWYNSLISNPSFNELDIRLVVQATPREIRMGLSTEAPERKIYMPAIAEKAHCNEKTASAHIRKMGEAGLFSYRSASDENGHSRSYLQPLPVLEHPSDIVLERAAVGGSTWKDGKRVKRCIAPDCRSANLATVSQVICLDCGTVQSEKTIKPVNDPHSQSDTGLFELPEFEAAVIVESEPTPTVRVTPGIEEEIEAHSQSDTGPLTSDEISKVPSYTVSTVGVSTEIVEPPTELRIRSIWCCHRAKVPYTPHGRSPQKAKVNDASSWGTYDQAKKMYEESVGWKIPFDGIGLMCDGTFTLADYDHCLEHGQIAADRWDQIERINTYKEVSYSGTGIHSLSWGTIPAARKLPEIEMYCGGKEKGRFITWTGNHIIGTPTTIEHQQEQITALYNEIAPQKEILPTSAKVENARPGTTFPCATDEEIIRKAKNAANGAKFTSLWEGDITGYSTSSEADMALCNMLAYWTDGTVDTIRRLFCQSGLYREKWERADYSTETIEKAVDGWRLRQHQKSA